MTEPTTYEIELKGNVGSRALRPLIDDFDLDQSENGVTRLVGCIRDPSHLHGVVTHLASMHVEIISIAPVRDRGIRPETANELTEPRRSTKKSLPLGSSPWSTSADVCSETGDRP